MQTKLNVVFKHYYDKAIAFVDNIDIEIRLLRSQRIKLVADNYFLFCSSRARVSGFRKHNVFQNLRFFFFNF